MQSKLLILTIAGLITIVALSASPRSFAVEQPTGVPAWLQAHVGEGEGQIAQVVLQRARALYLKKVSEGAVKNPWSGKYVAFTRSFVQFDGEGEAANARPRAIGGHPAVVFRGICLRKDPDSPYANQDGYVPYGKLVDYAGGRSNGCTSWSRSDAGQVIPMMKEPTTLYIYPESNDIAAVAQAAKAGRPPSRAGLYWNASCLRAIGAPKFWPKETLEPILAQYKRDHPAPPAGPTPICKP